MRHFVNGREVEIPLNEDGTVEVETVRKLANVPAHRALVLKSPDGSNEILNPGSRVLVRPMAHFADMPQHARGC